MRSLSNAGVAPALLPAVLSLLRTKSREVVKSVLGFVKVTACHLTFLRVRIAVAVYLTPGHTRWVHRPRISWMKS